MDGKNLVVSDEDTFPLIQFLEDRLYEYNSSVTNKDDGHLFSRIVKDENGYIVAGIAGWTWAGVCEVTQLWVDQKCRNTGVGKLLLDAAEREANDRGCLRLLIRTFSIQASEFYLKCGYQMEHVVNDFPAGYQYCIVSKWLRPMT